MHTPEHYTSDVLFFFAGHPLELTLYQALFTRLDAMFPEGAIRVQRTQISFYGRHLFAAASMPVRRKKGWPKACLMVSIGLGRRLDSSRAAAAVEPYPGRWTNHVLLTRSEEVDEELLGWLEQAWRFSLEK